MTMDAILAINANGGWDIIVIDREAVLYFIDSAKTLQWQPHQTPCKEAPGGAVFLSIKTMPLAGGGNDFIMVGMFVCLCLASQKPSEGEFSVPARTDLGVKLLVTFYFLSADNVW